MNSGVILNIIKIGGNVIDDPDALNEFLEHFSSIKGKKILVHGGGKKASALAQRLGVQVEMVDGRRVTNQEMLEIAVMVYAGWINKSIVAKLQKFGCDAIGLSGADANLIEGMKRPKKEVDFGYVGDLLHDSVNHNMLKKFMELGLTPVFSAITHNRKGQLLNTNADTIASNLSASLSRNYQVNLIYCFEKDGVLKDVEDESSVIEHMDLAEYQFLEKSGKIFDGMLPKLNNAFDALQKGVSTVYIGNASKLHQFNQGCFGTRITL